MVNVGRDLSSDQTCTTILSRGLSIGLLFTVESGFLSVVAVLVLFYIIIRNIRRHSRNSPGDAKGFFRSPLDVYMLSLFISDLIQGIGIVLSLHWVVRGTVQCGTFCTAQGVIQQLGETTVALATLAIAVHTFITIFFRKLSQGLLIPTIVICVIWFYVILMVAIPAGVITKGRNYFDTPSPYWCWIGSMYLKEKIAGEYFWFWFTALVSLVLYLIIFLCLRGNIVREDKGWGFRFRHRPAIDPHVSGLPTMSMDQSFADDVPRYSTDAAKKAISMLLYPAAYVVLILPLSAVRWVEFADPNISIHPVATFMVITIFGLSGVVNVTLILLTRPGLLLLGEPAQPPLPGPFFGSSGSVVSDVQPASEPESVRLRSWKSVGVGPDISQGLGITVAEN